MRETYVVSQPGFIADINSIVRTTGVSIDWSQVREQYRETPGFEVEVTAAAAAGAVAVAVSALPGAVKSGTIIDFGGDEIVRTTADAAAGAVSLAVTALTAALEGGETAVIAGSGRKMIRAGIPVGTTLGDGASPRRAGTNPAVGVLFTSAVEGDRSAAMSGYGLLIGGALYENRLPEEIDEDTKTELNDAGTGFAWLQYFDSRSS
jgi:hypothetical protein